MNELAQSKRPSTCHARDIRLLGLDEIKPNLHRRYLVKGWLGRGELSMLYGDSNVGKTFVALDLAFHVAAGTDWHGNRVASAHCVERGAVVYIASEGSMGLSCRIDAIRIAHPELYQRAQAEQCFFLLATPVDFYGGKDLQDLIAELKCLPRKIDLIIVDTLARSMGAADENAARDMNILLSNIDRLREETGAHVMMVHHTGKNASQGARGSSALRAAVATEIRLSREGDRVIAQADKQRDMDKGKRISFSLTSVLIGHDADGDPVDSLVVQHGISLNVSKPAITGQAKAALEVLKSALTDDRLSEPELTVRDGRCGIALEVWQRCCGEHPISSAPTESGPKMAFGRARDKLVETGAIEIVDDFVFLVEGGTPSHPSQSVTL